MKASLIIRADAGASMGTGHVMRCIALGQLWQAAGGGVTFITYCELSAIRARVVGEGFELIELSSTYPDSTDDLSKTREVIEQKGAAWLVLDGYHFDDAYHREIRRNGIKLLCIDDYNHLTQYEADLILNQNPGAESYAYSCNPSARIMAGSRYALLRKEFRRAQASAELALLGKNVLITFGGGDFGPYIASVINAFFVLGHDALNLRVITGASEINIEDYGSSNLSNGVSIEFYSNAKNMEEHMRWADVCISAGGSTCWELCYLGVPTLLVSVADNQVALAEALSRKGAVEYFGWYKEVFPKVLAISCIDLLIDRRKRQRLARASKTVVDGFGVERVLYALSKDAGLDLFASRLRLRNAGQEDATLLWKWANDPAVRKNCYQPEMIPFDAHLKWFNGRLNAEDCRIFIFEMDDQQVGQVRYERRLENGASVGFSIAEPFRGLGFGKRIISMSLQSAFNELNMREIYAEVFLSNKISCATFNALGFEDTGECVIKGVKSKVFVYRKSC